LWFALHLKTIQKTGAFDVAGITLPGVPFVIVGHNQRIGWGFTNVGPTVEDDFIEEFNAQGQYKTPAGWVDAQHRQETIHVKGKPDVVIDVMTTRHGPIITELLPGETRKIALRWTLQDGEGLVFFDVNTAQNWDEFRKAFSTFGAPGQNVMYADVDGHIGYQATGRVPIRASGDGSLPVSGSDDAHEWIGWVPFMRIIAATNRQAAIPRCPNRHASRSLITDVAIHVRVHHILSGRAKSRKGLAKLVPIL